MGAERPTVASLLAEAPGLERASRLDPVRLPVPSAFEEILPSRGLQPGTTVAVTGSGATSLALALVSRTTDRWWTAVVGLPALGLRAAAEAGVCLDRFVVLPDPGDHWASVLTSVIDAFDVVVAPARLKARDARRARGRLRERDAVLVVLGRAESDVTILGSSPAWHGIGHGYGHLRARTLDVVVTGRGAASRPRRATLWLPDEEGEITLASRSRRESLRSIPVALRRTG